jgi:hypothetical protein
MIPKHSSSEFFAFFSVFEKFAGILGPAVFSLVIAATGSSRGAILSLILFFLVGGVLLALVNVEGPAGARAEAQATGRTRPGVARGPLMNRRFLLSAGSPPCWRCRVAHQEARHQLPGQCPTQRAAPR